MSRSAFAGLRDFSEPEVPETFEEEVEDDRLPPEEVARLVEAAAEEARREGHAAGYAEGQEAERASVAARMDEQVENLLSEIAALREHEEQLFAEVEERTSRLMLALVHQLARRLSEVEAKRLAENVAMRAIEAVRGKHRITIRATGEFIEPLRAILRLPTDEDAAAHRIVFETTANDEESPLEVAWLTGKVTFDPYAFTGAIDEVFTETLNSLTGGQGKPLREGESQ